MVLTPAEVTPVALWVAALSLGTAQVAERYLARGWLSRDVALQVGKSRVPNAGRGVFAGKSIAAGTTLGAYPGRRLNAQSYYAKRNQFPRFTEYCWVLEDQQLALDPTDDEGVLCDPLPRMRTSWINLGGSIDTTLALINEPPPSADVNLATQVDGSQLVISTARDIGEGEELFLDYGPSYDRSGYGSGAY